MMIQHWFDAYLNTYSFPNIDKTMVDLHGSYNAISLQ